MPIKACADKLTREVELFGKDFSGYVKPDPNDAIAETVVEIKNVSIDPLKIVKKHSKAAAKAGVEMYFNTSF